MPGSTTKGLPYPLPTEPVAAGADAIKALAQALDPRVPAGKFVVGSISAAGAIVAGTGFTVVAAGGGAYTVTFPAGTFAAPPIVIATGAYGPAVSLGLTGAISATSFSIQIVGPLPSSGAGVNQAWTFLAFPPS